MLYTLYRIRATTSSRTQMAPIQFLFTSVLVLSAAVVAAPINTNHVDAGMAGEVSQPLKG
jgi:hypothetical protein